MKIGLITLILVLLIIIVIKIFSFILSKHMRRQMYKTLTELLKIPDDEADMISSSATEELIEVLKIIIETISIISVEVFVKENDIYRMTEQYFLEILSVCKNRQLILNNKKEQLIQKIIYNYLSTIYNEVN